MAKNKSEKESWSSLFAPRTVVATAALFVSACSLFLTITQMRANREAQYLEVLPYVSCGVSEGNMNDEDSTATFKMMIYNKGLGPAFLHSVKIHSLDKTFEANNFGASLRYLCGFDFDFNSTYSSISKNYLLPAGGDIMWFSPHDPKIGYKILKKMWTPKNEYVVKICFGDVYGRLWTVDSVTDQVEKCEECP
jgi:hypothetical protein